MLTDADDSNQKITSLGPSDRREGTCVPNNFREGGGGKCPSLEPKKIPTRNIDIVSKKNANQSKV